MLGSAQIMNIVESFEMCAFKTKVCKSMCWSSHADKNLNTQSYSISETKD